MSRIWYFGYEKIGKHEDFLTVLWLLYILRYINLYLWARYIMPTEPSTNPTTPSQTWDSTNTNGQTPVSPTSAQISDLGDILMEQTLDTVQANDFQAVSHDDVHQLSDENTESSSDSSSSAPDAASTSSSTSDTSIDLGDIFSESETPAVAEAANVELPVETVVETPVAATEVAAEIPVESPVEPETPAVAELLNNVVAEASTDLGNIDIWWEWEIAPIEDTAVVEAPVVKENSQADDTLTIDLGDITTDSSDSVVAETPVIDAPVVTEEVITPEVSVDLEAPAVESLASEEVVETATDLSSLDMWLENADTQSESIDEAAATTETSDIQNTEETANEEDGINFDALENMTLPDSETVVLNEDINTDDKPSEIILEQATVENSLDLGDLSSSDQPNENTEIQVDQTPVIETPSVDVSIPVETVVETPVVAPEAVVELPNVDVNIEDKLAGVAEMAEKIEEGMDLDSLVMPEVVETSTDTTTPSIQSVNQDTTNGVASAWDAVSAHEANKKPLKMALLGMGVVATAGILYFGYQTVFPVWINGPTSEIINNSGDLFTGGSIEDALSGDSISGDTTDVSMNTTGDIIIGGEVPTSGDVDSTTTGSVDTPVEVTRTLDDIKSDMELLAGKARKLLIKATIAKNGPARITAFSIQKDIDTFTQSLANTTDMTTLDASEKTLSQLTQRLVSLENKLNGSSN